MFELHTVRCTQTDTWIPKKWTMHPSCPNLKTHPKLYAECVDIYENLCWTISTFTCWASPILVFLLYFLSLGRYHTTINTAAYVEHPWTNAPPMLSLLGNAFVSLWESYFTKFTLKPKFLKLPYSTSLVVFPPKHTMTDWLKYVQISV